MHYLQQGISGFRKAGDSNLPRVDVAVFKSATYSAARQCGFEVTSVALTHNVRNFFHLDIKHSSTGLELTIACNCVYPVCGLFHSPMTYFQWNPADHQPLQKQIEPFGFRVLSAAELIQQVTEEELQMLSPEDLRQVAQWKPKTVMELIFNWWD